MRIDLSDIALHHTLRHPKFFGGSSVAQSLEADEHERTPGFLRQCFEQVQRRGKKLCGFGNAFGREMICFAAARGMNRQISSFHLPAADIVDQDPPRHRRKVAALITNRRRISCFDEPAESVLSEICCTL